MKNKMKIVRIVVTTIVLFCTLVGGIGILTAPKSGSSQLEQELEQNQQMLKQLDSEDSGETKAPAPENNQSQPDSKENPEKSMETKETTLSVIGDSVFLGAAPAFKKEEKNAVIDAKISRQVVQGLDVAKQLQKKDKLGDIVIISLGTNGNFNEATGQELIDFIGAERTIYWINVYGKKISWQKKVNSTIDTLVEKNENVHLISWENMGKKHKDWFYPDGIHLNETGQEGFARFVKECVGENSPG